MDHQPGISIRIDDQLAAYAPCFDPDWAERIEALAAGTKLAEPVFQLGIHWRAATNTCALPWIICRALEPAWREFTAAEEPLAQRLTATLAERIGAVMAGQISGAKQRRLAEAVAQIARELQALPAETAARFGVETLWETLLGETEFVVAVWGAQRLAYGSVYHAYEHFLRESVALAAARPDDQGRKLSVLFRDARRLFGARVAADCLASQQVTIARLVRNSLAHHGGRLTPGLAELPHGLIVEGGVLQILVLDVRALVAQLQARALRLVRAAAGLPPLASPGA